MYYGILTASVSLFGLQFWFNRRYQEDCGSGLKSTLVFVVGTYAVGSAVLFCLNGFRLECTPFAAFLALLTAVNNIAYSLFSLRAFARVNLSLYSVFSMLGGMALPFLCGVLFFGEAVTLGKIVCVVLVVAALLCTVEKGKKGGILDLLAIFFLNGMSGVLAKIYQAGEFSKTSDTGFSLLAAVFTLLIVGIVLPFAKKGKEFRLTRGAVVSLIGCGTLSRVGNLLLLISLSYLPASAQYPFVTGGVMICSTVLCYFTPQKPSRREWWAVTLSLIGILALVLISI